MDNSNDFRRAKALISLPEAWCRGNGMKDSNGDPTSDHSKVVQMCAIGACYYIQRPELCEILHKIARKLGYSDVMELNDETNHQMVMDVFDIAIGEAFIADKTIFRSGDIVEKHTGRWQYWTTIHTEEDANAAVRLEQVWFRIRRFNREIKVSWLT